MKYKTPRDSGPGGFAFSLTFPQTRYLDAGETNPNPETWTYLVTFKVLGVKELVPTKLAFEARSLQDFIKEIQLNLQDERPILSRRQALWPNALLLALVLKSGAFFVATAFIALVFHSFSCPKRVTWSGVRIQFFPIMNFTP